MKLRDSFEIAENTIHIRRQQLLNGEILFDRFSLVNFNHEELNLSLALSFGADFVDVFQVRGTAPHSPWAVLSSCNTVTAFRSSTGASTEYCDKLGLR